MKFLVVRYASNRDVYSELPKSVLRRAAEPQEQRLLEGRRFFIVGVGIRAAIGEHAVAALKEGSGRVVAGLQALYGFELQVRDEGR